MINTPTIHAFSANSKQEPHLMQLVSLALVVKKQTKSTLSAGLQAWKKDFESALCNRVKQRKQLQKMEFLTIWLLILLLAVGQGGRGVVEGDEERSSILSAVLSYTGHRGGLLYIEASLLTRVLAYAVDFANARSKLGKLPAWLILHHLGVMAVHTLTAFYFSQSYSKTVLYLLAIQSTHNTWTKKYSLPLYWGNVLLGVLTSVTFTIFNIIQDEVTLSLAACLCMMVALLTTFTGIGLLVVECRKSKSKSKS
jgi:hypothetical protein